MGRFDNLIVESFNSTLAFANAQATRGVNDAWRGQHRASRETGDSGWYGTSSWEEAVELSVNGYPEAVERMKATVDTVNKQVLKRVELRPTRPRNGFVGSTPNVPRAMMGLPRDMRYMEKQQKQQPGVVLAYESGILGDVSTEEIIESGSGMVCLLKLLERAQIPTKLITTSTNYMSGDAYSLQIVQKEFHAGFNIQKLAFYLAHPSFHRRFVFSWRETSPVVKNYSSGYGRSVSADREGTETVRRKFKEQGILWFCYKDFRHGADDVVRIWKSLGLE